MNRRTRTARPSVLPDGLEAPGGTAGPDDQLSQTVRADPPAGPPRNAHRRPRLTSADQRERDLADRERQVRAAAAGLQERERALQAAEELAQLGSWRWQIGSDLVTWSRYVHEIFGTESTDPASSHQTYLSMVHPDDRDRLVEAIRAAVTTRQPFDLEHRIVRRDGRIREIRTRGRAEGDAEGQPVLVTGGMQDVTEMRRAARELQTSRDLFAGVLDAATEQSIIATDPDGLITVFNTGAERMLGYRAQDMIGTSPERLHDPDEMRARATELGMEPGFGVFLARPATGQPETRHWTYYTRDGRRLLASITVSAMHGPCGEVTGFIKVGTDITERVRAQTALEESEARFRSMFQFAPNGMMLLGIGPDNLGRFLQVNPAMCRLTGYPGDRLLGMSMADLVAPEDREGYAERLAAFRHHPVIEGAVERHWIHADGSDLWVQVNVSDGEADAPAGAYVIGQVEDVTARKRVEETLRHQALHDGLTGLPNRVLLMDRIEHALAVGVRTGRHVGVLLLDLDGFKGVNDAAGHAAGDQALIHVGDRIRAVLRPGDTVARLGGDEFVVVCEDLESAAEAAAIADRVLRSIRFPFTVGGEAFALGGSIGVSLSDPSSTPALLLRQADEAMYRAKGSGKGRVQVGGIADPARVAESAQAARALRLTAELHYAVERDELVLFGQPVVDLATGAVVAVESLLRWQHPTGEVRAPGDFLDVAEASDLMVPIGRRVLRESCRMAATWPCPPGQAAPAVHVNVSGRQLEAGSLYQDTLAALAEFGLHPSRLVLELTETHMPLIANSLKADLEILRRRGVRVAIDDFGTGYSSLTRITELPVDILKIDSGFVAQMETDPASAAVVRGILSIGEALGLHVIAEGVETPSHADHLREAGCTTAQGYLFSRPLPEDALHAHLGSGPGTAGDRTDPARS